MAITREKKEELVARYGELLARTDGFILAEFKGMSVAQTNQLRNALAPAGGTYSVAKNTLFRIALQENGWVVPTELLKNSTGVVFGNGNLPGVAKVVQSYLKEGTNADIFIIKGGVVERSVFSGKELDAIANLPTMDEIRAQLIGTIVAPASQLAGLLAAATSQLVNVLQAYEDKHQSGEAA